MYGKRNRTCRYSRYNVNFSRDLFDHTIKYIFKSLPHILYTSIYPIVSFYVHQTAIVLESHNQSSLVSLILRKSRHMFLW